MIGAFLALLGLLAALAAAIGFQPASLQSGPLLLLGLASVLIVWAALRRARPVLLLAAIATTTIAFACLPQGLDFCLRSLGVDVTLQGSAPVLWVPVAAMLTIFALFWLLSLKQSGGFALSAQEASEDIERFLAFFGYVALAALSFLVVSELLQALHSALTAAMSWSKTGEADLMGLPDLSLLATDRHDLTHVAIWVLMLCGGLAYLRNAHQRGLGGRSRSSETKQAARELIGAILGLLPACWLMLRYIAMRDPAGEPSSYHPEASEIVQTPELVGSLLTRFDSLVPAMPIQLGIVLLAVAAVAVALRSLVFLVGPDYLKRRAASHISLQAGSRFLRPGTAIGEKDRDPSSQPPHGMHRTQREQRGASKWN